MVQTLILKLGKQKPGYSFQTLCAENDPGNLLETHTEKRYLKLGEKNSLHREQPRKFI